MSLLNIDGQNDQDGDETARALGETIGGGVATAAACRRDMGTSLPGRWLLAPASPAPARLQQGAGFGLPDNSRGPGMLRCCRLAAGRTRALGTDRRGYALGTRPIDSRSAATAHLHSRS